ncbi:ataxin-3-like isoform X2 [Mizuhopecten yessoensis]|uniref:ataxin-3-like isoform X2 n=1 Tax=Mizuhopecten yessoensis TaxID=6573 RepID=UPI000B4598C1|nr:ataxin-3-like isoform X2 [Mizuhopecten yessoensis]
METIFHEQQEGSLCAQHCLNALLQAQYFSPVDLADLAKQLDESEREQMAIAGEQSEEYKKFLKEPSSNLDDSGFFSIQVIDRALSVWGLGLILYNSPNPVAIAARINPVEEKAYICNFRGHWLTIRKIGHQWFNLNSLLTGPELISNTYLSLFLKQLLEEGYSIFIVGGNLPECEADMLLKIAPVKQQVKPKLINENLSVSSNQPMEEEEDDQQLQKVLAESRHADEHDDQALQKALQLSMEGYAWEPLPGPSVKSSSLGASAAAGSETRQSSSPPPESPDPENVRQKRLAYLSRLESPKTCDKSEQNSLENDTTPSNNQKDISELEESKKKESSKPELTKDEENTSQSVTRQTYRNT